MSSRLAYVAWWLWIRIAIGLRRVALAAFGPSTHFEFGRPAGTPTDTEPCFSEGLPKTKAWLADAIKTACRGPRRFCKSSGRGIPAPFRINDPPTQWRLYLAFYGGGLYHYCPLTPELRTILGR